MGVIDINVFLFGILLPACVVFIFSLIRAKGVGKSKTMSDENFVVKLPNAVLVVGAICDIMSAVVLLSFTILSKEQPHFIFYLFFGLLFWLGVYLIIKTLTFKLTVKGEEITVFSAFKKPYIFRFDEITSAVRQVKNNQIKSERIVIKTISEKKVIVESSETSYHRFLKKIRLKVRNEYLIGF